jgi:hypothetical protein
VPVPSRWASVAERCQLARAMGRAGRGVWGCVPELVNVERQIASVRELAEISRAAGRPASFQPLLTVPLGLYPIVTLEKQLPNMIGNLV